MTRVKSWLAASVLLALLASWWSGAERDAVRVEHLTPAVRSAAETVPKTSERGFVPIEAIRVGDRVLADNPDDGRPPLGELRRTPRYRLVRRTCRCATETVSIAH